MIDSRQIAECIGARIQHWRQARLLSVAELADRVGASEYAVRSWEAGRVDLSARLLVSVAAALQCEPYTLLPSLREFQGMVRQ